MRHRMLTAILSAAGGFVLFSYAGGSGAQPVLATGPDADVTEEGLHRVEPLIMEAAWVRPDFDLSGYTRILLMPTAVQFREIVERKFNARSSIGVTDFPLGDEKKEWLRGAWRRAVNAEFSQENSYELYTGAGSDVLVVQAFLVDVVSHIPPDDVGSAFTLVKDPWSVSVVLELRDGSTAELLARTIDQRHAEGLVEVGRIWVQTETHLMEIWADALSERLDQLTDIGGRVGMRPLGP